MTEPKFDVVVVGAGIAGAIIAKELTSYGKRVLLLEAGEGPSDSPEAYWNQYGKYLSEFYRALAKTPNSPYPKNPNAPVPSVLDFHNIRGNPDTSGYMVQNGPLPFSSNYVRALGGTTLHWLGTCLRMLPNDFRLKSLYGQGVNWPIGYRDLEPYYVKAEREIGVAGDVEDQQVLARQLQVKGWFGKDYVFPMMKLPESYLDQRIKSGLGGLKVRMNGQDREVLVVSTPQGRNSTPNPKYKHGGETGFEPLGAVGGHYRGERCEGNAACVPICPVQAKYNALKTLYSATQEQLEIRNRSVASKIEIDPASGRVTGIAYKRYLDKDSPQHTVHTARGTVYVIAAHSVETATLLLASRAANSSGMVGRNLMDHVTMLRWGLMPQNIGSYRGPGSTSNIASFRDGDFRKKHSAFIVPIDNWGWSWAKFSPYSDVSSLVDGDPGGSNGAKRPMKFGPALRQALADSVTRQFTLQFEFEQLPDPANRVRIDSRYRDRLGNYRPIVDYNLSGYVREAMAAAAKVSNSVFKKLGADDKTQYDPNSPGYLEYKGQEYQYAGAGHLIGTHRMGSSPSDSVVNSGQQTWDHENLFLAGCGNMPTIGTSNPTLTMAALAFRAAESIRKALR